LPSDRRFDLGGRGWGAVRHDLSLGADRWPFRVTPLSCSWSIAYVGFSRSIRNAKTAWASRTR
jgi:hypothetical protein